MFRLMLSLMLGIAPVAPAFADQPAAPTQTQPTTPDKRAESSVPSDGVIHPAPDVSRDKTVNPPNVDPNMAVKPPGTPGGNPNVVPK
jgi:hypothetical protein